MNTKDNTLDEIRQLIRTTVEEHAITEYISHGLTFHPETINIPTRVWDKLVTLSEK